MTQTVRPRPADPAGLSKAAHFAPSERLLDPRFYRAAYEDAAGMPDAALLAAARAGTLAPGRALNPTEFIQQVIAGKLLPAAFDPLGYRLQTPSLWGAGRADWEAALHYVKYGRAADAGWQRPFEPAFYQDAYLPGVSAPELLAAHHRSHPEHHGSLDEALLRNGWNSRDWTQAFDTVSYAVYNTLTERLRSPAQTLLHFIETGWRDCLAMAADLEFDAGYYADLAGAPATISRAEAYRLWVERGLAAGIPANEPAALKSLGLALIRYPDGFDWQRYLAEQPDATVAGRAPGKWDALQHLINRGVLAAQIRLPVTAAAMPDILLAAADRFVLAGRDDDAAACYDRALLYPSPSVPLLEHAAELAARQNRPAAALALCRRVGAMGPPSFTLLGHAAQAALAVGEWDEAAEWAFAALAHNPRSVALEDTLLQIQRTRFDQAVARHIGALRAGAAETGLAEAMDGILELFARLHRVRFGEPPPPLPRANCDPLRVVMLANQDLAQCTAYRVDAKRQQLGGIVAWQVFDRSQDAAFRSAVATADIAVFYRVASNVAVLHSLAACRAAGVPTVYELDDLVTDPAVFPEALASYGGTISAEEHFGLRAGVSLAHHAAAACDAAIASTECLAAELRRVVRSGRALVHRNGLSPELAAFARAAIPASREEVTLFYGSGTKAHAADFQDLLAPALTRLMAECPQTRFVACGHVDAQALAARFPGRVEWVAPIADRDAYLAQLMAVDVNLAVLRPSLFNDCKSETKWLEAAAFCVPSVVSDVAGHRETLQDGVHVVRVPPSKDAWFTALHSLVTNPARRAAIGAAARDHALALYAPAVLGRQLAAGLQSWAAPAVKPKRRALLRRPRLLLMHVFFPPQAIGGATRIVRDQVSELAARYADRYELGVLCGNDEPAEPYSVQSYRWQGVPVWSVANAQREHMDWQAFDPAMAAPVEAVLDRFQPDLVHAHCIQRLTATALQSVAARAIPYVVTAHDAWWVSDHQFLTDAQNRLRMPWDSEAFETAANPHSRAASWSRRLKLRGVLDQAAAVLTVSQAFAAIYRRAGVTRVTAVPNGLPALPALVATPPVPGRVRLAHLGGVMAHKGYFLLRQALGRGNYQNLDLLVMDHALPPGEVQHARWGATPVLITGRLPQEAVGALYGRFDVLCAPSLWPESYGLVAREALHYGRWVIAGNLGAIGEDVTPGQNGWVVDVSGPEELTAVLAQIDADPARYSQPPKLRPAGRPAAQQVAEVVEIYAAILAKAGGPGAGQS